MQYILQWIFVFAAALASVFTLQSCGLEEPFPGPQSGISEGTVEFVARPAGYNNHDVTTKADGDFDDAEIHNAFLLLFNNEGKRILCEEINNKDGQLSAKIDRGLGGVTACILANVPASFAQGIIGATNPNSEPNLTDGSANGYLNTAVLDLTYNSTVSGTLGVPVLNLDDDTSTAAVPCIPMIGQTVVSTTESKIQISLSRLFAKISVNLGLDIDLDNWSADIVNYASFFQLTNYQVVNLPTKVKLVKDVSQSKWSNSDSFDQATSGTLQNNKVYNGNTTSFEFYVPEYYIDTLTEKQYYALSDDDDRTRPNKSYGNAKFKPLCYNKETTKPIYLLLTGSYSQFSYNTTNLQYEVYLGRDEHSDFTLERNVKYNNILTINGVKNNNQGSNDDGTLDHRVTTDVINNPVAVAGQSANCYIIANTGEYKFPAYKGAYKDLTNAVLCSGNKSSTVVDLTEGNHSGIAFEYLRYDADKNMIIFKLSSIDNGNVVIALKNGDSIEWSWHLWCKTESSFDAFGWGAMSTETYPSGADMMDRNLGATPNTTQSITPGIVSGLYYKYGCKEPFISNGYKGGGTNGSNTWENNGAKAVNDPCPPGYKVPSKDVFSGNITKEHEITYTAFRFWDPESPLLITNDVYFPYSGELLTGNNQAKTTETESRNYTTVITDELTLSSYKFTNIHYPETPKKNGTYGALSTTSSANYIQYLYSQLTIKELISNLEPVKLDYKEGKWVSTGWFSGYYEYPDAWTKDVQYSSLSRTAKTAYQTIKTFSSSGLSDLYGTSIIMNYSANANNGYQVRCVSEDSPVQ